MSGQANAVRFMGQVCAYTVDIKQKEICVMGDKGFFKELFDLDGDGELDSFERAVDAAMYLDLVEEEEKEAERVILPLSTDDDDDFDDDFDDDEFDDGFDDGFDDDFDDDDFDDAF